LGRPQAEHDYLYWDYGHVRKTYMQALRMGDWKGVRVGKNSPLELYHLKRDQSETKNVAAENPQVVARIEELMKSAVDESEDYPIGDVNAKRR
ncbi:MAG: arylsulfatase, partial [Planctomycetota bacterium]|jgi:arylsulfatase A-like enzyme